MRITYFNYVWDIEGISAGAATKARELIAALKRRGHEVSLHWRTPQPASANHRSAASRLKANLKPRLQRYLHEPKKLLRNLPHLLQEFHILRNEQPDILFTRLELYNFSGRWLSKALHIPLVVEADCPPSYEHKTFYGKSFVHLGRLPEQLELATLRHADAIIAISTVLRNYYIELGIAAEKIHVIPNGADPEKFKPRPRPAQLEARYNLAGKVVIGWIGALVGWSGIERFAQTARELLLAYPNAVLMIVAGGANKALFERELKQGELAERVVLPGLVSHALINDYLACMDIVLAPYPRLPFWYASSMKIFEYMAAGKAIVASNIGQVGEVLHDRENALLYDPEKPDALRRQIEVLLKNPALRRELGVRAREDLVARYTWDRHAKELEMIFARVTEKNSPQNLVSMRKMNTYH